MIDYIILLICGGTFIVAVADYLAERRHKKTSDQMQTRISYIDRRCAAAERKVDRARVVNVYHHAKPATKGLSSLIPLPPQPRMDL